MMERKCGNCKWFRQLLLIRENSGDHFDGWCINTKHIESNRKIPNMVYGGTSACFMYEGTDDQMEIKESEN